MACHAKIPTEDTLMPSAEHDSKVECVKRSRSNDENGGQDGGELPAKRPHLQILASADEAHDPRLSLDALRKSLPAEVYVKSLRRSLQWMAWDIGVWSAGLYLLLSLYRVDDSTVQGLLGTFGPALRLVTMGLLQVAIGFFMWGTFVVGHDCGHGSFSDSKQVNFLCGLINHGSILVPFTPWARSHRFHHLYHNHVEKDHSFHWTTDPALDTDNQRMMTKYQTVAAAILPFFGYSYYLLLPQSFGGVDGCHWLPGVFKDRIWEKVDFEELWQSWVSVVACFGFFCLYSPLSAAIFSTWTEFFTLYAPCWIWFCFFLFTVTYLQHHSEDTKVYDDTTFKYATAAFETVDRTYGHYVDLLHHHISDCHVVHHLFFTKIPHYNLKKATEGLVAYLEKNDLKHLYKHENTPDFFVRVFTNLAKYSMRAKLLTTNANILASVGGAKTS